MYYRRADEAHSLSAVHYASWARYLAAGNRSTQADMVSTAVAAARGTIESVAVARTMLLLRGDSAANRSVHLLNSSVAREHGAESFVTRRPRMQPADCCETFCIRGWRLRGAGASRLT